MTNAEETAAVQGDGKKVKAKPEAQKAQAMPRFSSPRFSLFAIRPYVSNTFYWQYKGTPVLLLGATDDDNLFQWTGKALTNQLDTLKSCGGNYVRNVMSDRDRVGLAYGLNVDNVYAFRKTGERYDLDQWNEEYWNRLRRFLEETARRDIIVQLTFWDIHDLRSPAVPGTTGSWTEHPWNPRNNVNYTSAETGLPEEIDTASPGEQRQPRQHKQRQHPFFHTVPALNNAEKVLMYQQRFVRQILAVSLPYDHVLYNVENFVLSGCTPSLKTKTRPSLPLSGWTTGHNLRLLKRGRQNAPSTSRACVALSI